jgi:hypothetical protein
MTMSANSEIGPERTRLNFANAVTEAFSFLGDLGFAVAEALPTLVRYRKGEIEARLYHGRRSFEVGFEIVRDGERYSISELIRAADRVEGEQYRDWTATTQQGIAEALGRLKELVSRYGERALQGDPGMFETLTKLRQEWMENYSLDVLASQLRPKADAAFRSGDYREAAALYEKILPRLSPSELKKLALAKERAES